METIKISVDVNINLSNDAKQFIASIFACNQCNCGTQVPTAPAKPAPAASAKPAPAAPAKPAPTAPAEKPGPAEKPSLNNAPVVEKPAEKPVDKTPVTIEQIRAAVSKKSKTHYEKLKEKLSSYGATGVGSLAKEYYEEFFEYVNSLS